MEKMTENEIKLAKASALKGVLIFVLEYQRNNPDCDKDELFDETVKYLEETIDCYE